MRKLLQVTGRIVALGVLVLGIVLGISGYRYWREMSIDESRGVNESGYVRIGGIDQWVQIRGEDRRNPVLLWLNGGPGFSVIPATPLFRSWERQFTVVMWDQRGEGRTFANSGAQKQGPMTVERMTEDGLELTTYLRAHLHQDRIVVLGHSWGSILGVRMVKQRPDFFSAYVGTGQVTSFVPDAVASYPLTRARAHAQNNQAAETLLTAVGPPPYDRPERYLPWLIWANELDPGQIKLPHSAALPWAIVAFGVQERRNAAGSRYSQVVMLEPMLHTDLPALGNEFGVPVIFIQGSEDLVTVTSLAKDYFNSLVAPHKEFIVLPGDGHLALVRDRDAFLAILINRVRPLAVRYQGGR